jgi:hypothetical protein
VLSIVDRAVDALTRAGHPPAEAFAGYLALDGYVQGVALLIGRETTDTTYRTWRTATLRRLESTGGTRHRRGWPPCGTATRSRRTRSWTPGSTSDSGDCSTACSPRPEPRTCPEAEGSRCRTYASAATAVVTRARIPSGSGL